MKRFLQNIENALADSALLEMGVAVALVERPKTDHENLEENLIEIAFAEAAAYDQIHEAILREHQSANNAVQPDGCLVCKKDHCFA